MKKPFFSCISTCYNEGETLKLCIESMLCQTFSDFEFLIVDDGADEITTNIIKTYSENEQIIHIKQSNSGLSSARNRALSLAKGEYICFLDADDMRPIWSLQKIYEVALKESPDCIFTRGKFVPNTKNVLNFHDDDVFDIIISESNTSLYMDNQNKKFDEYIAFLPLIAPQSANKILKKSFLNEFQLKFPDGLIFEDMLFHSGVVSTLRSFSILNVSCFTYFTRYEHKQLTSSNNMNRLDSSSVALISLKKFYKTQKFENINLRVSLLMTLFHHLSWNESMIAFQFKQEFSDSISFLLNEIDESYFRDFYSVDFYSRVKKISLVHKGFSFLANSLNKEEFKNIHKKFKKCKF